MNVGAGKRINRRWRPLILIGAMVALALVLWLMFTRAQYRSVTDLLSDQHAATVEATYRTSSRMYELGAGIFFRELSRHPALTDWLQRAAQSDEASGAAGDLPPAEAEGASAQALTQVRDWFLRLFRPDYLRLEQEGFGEFSVHLADGSVLLRFHAPDMHGDSQLKALPSLVRAHAFGNIAVGFEGGAEAPALHHIYPVRYEDRLLGSLDLAVPFSRLQARLAELLPGNRFFLTLPAPQANAQSGSARASEGDGHAAGNLRPLGNGWVAVIDDDAPADDAATNVALSTMRQHAGNPAFASASVASAGYVEHVAMHGDRAYFASFVPLLDANQQISGYLVAVNEAPAVLQARQRFVAQALAGLVVLLSLGAALTVAVVNAGRCKLQERHAQALNNHLTTLIEGIPEPICFKDALGRWQIANRRMLDLFDFDGDQWRGKRDDELADLQPRHRYQFSQSQRRDEEALRLGVPCTYEDEVATASGLRIVEISKLPLSGGEGGRSLLTIHRDITAERQAKQRVEESERRYRDVVANVKEVIFSTDVIGRWTFLNPAWENLTGQAVIASLGQSVFDYIHPDDRQHAFELFSHLIEHRSELCRNEVRYRHGRYRQGDESGASDGGDGGDSYRWVEMVAQLAVDDAGHVIGTHGTLMDISERRSILEALRAERDLFAAGPVLVFVWRIDDGADGDDDGEQRDAEVISAVDYVSPNVFEALGYLPDTLTAPEFRFDDLIHPDDRARIRHYRGRRSNDQHALISEHSYRLRRHDGEYRWYRDYSVRQIVDGRPSLLLRGYLVDVTAAVETRQALELERQRLAWILEGADVGTWEWHPDSGVIAVNARWAGMLGFGADELGELDERSWRNLIHVEDREPTLDRMREHLNGECGYYEAEHRMRHKNGNWVWVLSRGRVLNRSQQGRPLLMCGTQMDITQRKHAESHATHLAFYDELTNLPNRRLLLERLQHAQATSERTRLHGALLFVDLDHFKNLNDTLGHGYGDLLLRQVATRLSQIVRKADTVARLGGDEFVILLEEIDPGEADAVRRAERAAQKVLASLSESYVLNEHRHHLTPSIGVTVFCGHDDSTDVLMKKADLAMYQAKAAGRGTFRFFDPDMQAAVEKRMHLEGDLRRALEREEFFVVYQPIVDVRGRVLALEALIRWRHPVRGIVSPAEFIPVAESTGLILPIGEWVLAKVCEQLAAWRACPQRAHWDVAVNVSARQFQQADFVAGVRRVLASSGAPGRRLRLEITESMLLDNIGEMIEKMRQLREEGVSFSLDDFGTGYSSLNYLKTLPLSVLKIDQTFVRDLTTDPNDAAIVKTIIAMAQSLGLRVVAEGVEIEAQRDFLLAHGCEALQGYLFFRPMNIEQLDEQLTAMGLPPRA